MNFAAGKSGLMFCTAVMLLVQSLMPASVCGCGGDTVRPDDVLTADHANCCAVQAVESSCCGSDNCVCGSETPVGQCDCGCSEPDSQPDAPPSQGSSSQHDKNSAPLHAVATADHEVRTLRSARTERDVITVPCRIPTHVLLCTWQT